VSQEMNLRYRARCVVRNSTASKDKLRIQADLNLTKRSVEDRKILCTGIQLFIAYFNTDVSRLVSTHRDKTTWLRIRLAALSCYCANHSQLSQFWLSLSEIACWPAVCSETLFQKFRVL
jgi:hypothetical protein